MSLRVREDVPLAPLTSLGLGGPARWLAEVGDAAALREALAWADERGLPVQVLGGGTNIVFPDAGFPGLVVRIVPDGLSFEEAGGRVRVRAAAGVPWDELVRASVERGLSGVECLSGIPGLAGAAPIQNIGAYGQELADTLVAVECLRRGDREVERLPAGACGFGYRTSRFKEEEERDRRVVLSLELELRRDMPPRIRYPELAASLERSADLDAMTPAAAVRTVRDHVLALRRGKSMVLDPDDPDARSAGSFFLNPVLEPEAFEALVRRHAAEGGSEPVPSFPAADGIKVPAAWLVERAGFRKGRRHGGVGISSAHALALVNRDGTTAELLELAGQIREAVRRRFGIELAVEPTIVEADPG